MSAVTADTRHLTASMVVIDPAAGKVLLVWHKATARWMFPGGHVDQDEAPHEAALREIHEETGVAAGLIPIGPTVKLPGMVQRHCPWMIQEIPAPPKPARGEPAHSHIDLLFIGTADSSLPLRDEEAGSCRPTWIPVLSVDRWNVRAEVPQVARRALEIVRSEIEG